ncbi:VirB4 family type IV secretion/conjugal transfer ATPase [Phenylobacterium deserti]|uniref:Transporter n=1 Tax=Phenylobacterium deserti TaxID=1914756 RepID=A0A328AHD7_9CAUL|nr:VirB4 family type IV secretion/conjugal transfer ATPase [Phenylobacterium deserti]RAK52774.1 transporter [Phenylobacterium deserti]
MAEPLARPAPAGALRREPEPGRVLPYARHVTESILALDSGGLMVCLELAGASFETADPETLNARHAALNDAWLSLAHPRLAVWHHLVRQPQADWPEGRFESAYAAELDAAWRARTQTRPLFANRLFLTLVLRPGSVPAVGTETWLAQRMRRPADSLTEREDVARLSEAGRDLVQHLARYGPRRLSLVERDGVLFSEPLEMLRLLLSRRPEPAPLVRGHLGAALYADRVIFGREALEIRTPGAAAYAGLLGIKAYPATTRPGQWDALLSAPFAFTCSQSFAFLSPAAAQGVLGRKQNQLVSAQDPAASQVDDLAAARDGLASGRFVLGEHQASVLVHGETGRALAQNMAAARALLAESGLVAAREDLGLEAAFWAQFPGNFRWRLRPAAITSRNFAALAPFHTHPAGQAQGCHWGAAVSRLRTRAGSPLWFSFHVGDLGHTFICGPSGSGKTVLQNLLLAQVERLGAQRVFIDKDRGAEIFIRASGGAYLALRPGEPTGFAPLKALTDAPADRRFLGRLLRALAAPSDRPLTAVEETALDAAAAGLLRLPAADRSMAAARSLLGHSDAGGIGARLERWTQGGALGWALDGAADALDLSPRLAGFDMTALLDDAEVRTPVLLYLFHRLQQLADGRRLVIDIDEFWKALGDPAFRALAEDGLKTFRKQNALLVLGTQSPADVLRSPIAHTLVEQCATQIFLPNPHATVRDYVEGFGLSRRELALVREGFGGPHRFLLRQGLESTVAELDLTGLDDHLAVLSGRAGTVALLERLRAVHGDDPARWRPAFHQALRESA